MPIIRALNVEREMTFHLYRAAGEQNRPDDLRNSLCSLGLEPRPSRKNPATGDVWKFVLDLARNPSVTGTAIFGVFALWLKERKGRRIEIERPGLKIKVPNARELRKALAELHEYDKLTLTLNSGGSPKSLRKKTVKKSS